MISNQMLKMRLTPNTFIIGITTYRSITTIISKKYDYSDFEPHAFKVSINTDNIPDNLTKPKFISSELTKIINSKYAKHELKEQVNTIGIKNSRNSPW